MRTTAQHERFFDDGLPVYKMELARSNCIHHSGCGVGGVGKTRMFQRICSVCYNGGTCLPSPSASASANHRLRSSSGVEASWVPLATAAGPLLPGAAASLPGASCFPSGFAVIRAAGGGGAGRAASAAVVPPASAKRVSHDS